MDEENMVKLNQNRYDETDPRSAEEREACISPQEMRGPADINSKAVSIGIGYTRYRYRYQ